MLSLVLGLALGFAAEEAPQTEEHVDRELHGWEPPGGNWEFHHNHFDEDGDQTHHHHHAPWRAHSPPPPPPSPPPPLPPPPPPSPPSPSPAPFWYVHVDGPEGADGGKFSNYEGKDGVVSNGMGRWGVADMSKHCKQGEVYTPDVGCEIVVSRSVERMLHMGCGSSHYGNHGPACNPEIVGDPHVLGFHGDRFDVSGEAQQFYTLLSDKNFHLNVFFVKGKTSVTDKESGEVKIIPGTFMRQAGMLVDDGFQKKIRVTAAKDGDENISLKLWVNGRTLRSYLQPGKTLNDTVIVDSTEIKLMKKHAKIRTPTWEVSLTAHLSKLGEVMLNLRSLEPVTDPFADNVAPHGLMGQTLDGDELAVDGATGVGAQGEGAIEGDIDDYIVSSLFATDCKYNRYHKAQAAPRDATKLSGATHPAQKMASQANGLTSEEN